jgi:DNA recombination protein RmuC
MIEVLLTLTLIAAAATAGLLGLFVLKEKASAREARDELAKGLGNFSQTISAQMGSHATVQNGQIENLRKSLDENLARLQDQQRLGAKETRDTLEQRLERLQQDNAAKLEQMRQTVDEKLKVTLDQISTRVNERLEEGFKKTNETFVNVMQRLATIDEAQKKIETLTGSVVTLQELLGDKRSRGAFGEVQLEALVRNVLPPAGFQMQYTLSTGARVDCVLRLPEPTGLVCVDSKFPLENYKLMLDTQASDADRALAQKAFRVDVKKHIDAIASKYIIENETSDGAVMFVPAEAVFAEIHAYHAETVEYANAKRVWIVSPTTLMAVLNTARAVLKDVETRKQIHVIKEALARLGQDFRRFDERMKKLADHIRQAHDDATEVQVSSRKISQQFLKIEAAELDEVAIDKPAVKVVRLPEN